MPPEDRFLPRFAAEPPQSLLPFGDWEQRLAQEFLSACLRISSDGLGDPGDIGFYPERTWSGRTYVPATCTTDKGRELFGLVSFQPAFEDGEEPDHFATTADWTEETIDNNPEWTIDLCDEVVGGWRGEGGEIAAMTAIWGSPVDFRARTSRLRSWAGWSSISALCSTDASRCSRRTTTAARRSRSPSTTPTARSSPASRSTRRTRTRPDGCRDGDPHAPHAQGVRSRTRRIARPSTSCSSSPAVRPTTT